MHVYGEAGRGFFVAPSLIAQEVVEHHDVEHLGDIDEVQERFYAITLDRRISNPVVARVSEAARATLQSDSSD